MNIRRNVMDGLLRWKESRKRKPLILQGARQVGKTWALKQFGKEHFDSVAYFNFEQQPGLKEFFATTKDPRRIIEQLSLLHGKAILPHSALIILDEIQECNEALNSLKYFCDEAPEYVIASAGSLLGVAMSRGASFPVGKVHFIQMYPVSFSEFLAESDIHLLHYLESLVRVETIPEVFFNPLKDKLKMYFVTGGMPEAVSSYLEDNDIQRVQDILQNILDAYSLDFSKHAENKDIHKINHIWASMPSQLAKENKKFLYQSVRPGARAREYENALLWLINAGLVSRIYCSSKPSLPLSAYDDLSAFKVYLSDVGLLRRLSQLDPVAITEGNRLFTEFKGAMTENFIFQSLVPLIDTTPHYWRSGNQAEVDFLIQHENNIIPIEVKSDENIRSKSLTYYRKAFNPPISIRYSLKNFKAEENVVNIPLFMVDFTMAIIRMCGYGTWQENEKQGGKGD